MCSVNNSAVVLPSPAVPVILSIPLFVFVGLAVILNWGR